MYNHAFEGHLGPFYRIVREIAADGYTEFVFQNNTVTAFMSLYDSPNNLGHIIVVPNVHYENIYDLPVPLATDIHTCSKDVAIAMKVAYQCDGISTRQHNEPAGGQDVWHYHMHISPRFAGDNFSGAEKIVTPAEKRAEYAAKLRAHFWKRLISS